MGLYEIPVLIATPQAADKIRQAQRLIGLRRREGSPPSRNHRSILGYDILLITEPEITDKRFTQGGREGERSAAKEHFGLNLESVRKGGNGLHGDGMKNGCRDIGLADVSCNQVLDVGFGEYAATRGNGVNFGSGLHGQLSHLVDRASQQGSHLVDESPGSAGTVAAHSHVGQRALAEKDHLGIFTANIDQGLDLGVDCSDQVGSRYDLLFEGEQETFGDPHPGRTGHGQPNSQVAKPLHDFRKQRYGCSQHIGVVSFIGRIDNLALFVHQYNFGSSRSNVQTGSDPIFPLSAHTYFIQWRQN